MQPDHSVPYVFAEPIPTSRLLLRLMTESDADDVYAYQSREDVCRFLLFEPRTHDEVVERVARHAHANELAGGGDYLQLAIELPATGDAPSRVIGDVYFALSSLENSRAEIGWTLHPDFTGRGYATEAARAVLALAFGTIRLHRVYAELDPRNTRSIALCARLGLREEALFVRDLRFKGDWADTGVYAILRDEWLAAH